MNNDIPNHIAIIMDGNGRWAKKRFLPKAMGHRAGAQALDRLVNEADDFGIKHMTVYAFSTENWNRSKEEVDSLMALMREYIAEYAKQSETKNVKIDFIGDLSIFDAQLRSDIINLENKSRLKTGINLHIALNYGGRDEIVRAVKSLSEDIKSGKLDSDKINEEIFSTYLDTKNYLDPDLIIRTSGECRLSNFLLWQAAYSEFYFTDKLWPDFTFKDLMEAINSYRKRDRRFGGRNEVK